MKIDIISLISSLSGTSQFNEETLFSDIGIDSLKTMELVALLEDKFDIEIPDEELIDENFMNIKSLESLLTRLI